MMEVEIPGIGDIAAESAVTVGKDISMSDEKTGQKSEAGEQMAEAVDGEETVGKVKEMETDEMALQRREKQIEYGKNTPEYGRYLKEVPLDQRGSPKEHPRTPDRTRKCSRRVWDGLVKSWRRSLHKWNVPLEEQTETDEKELAKRLKHLSSVKQTKQYEKYSLEVKRESRVEGEHPKTPDHTRKYASQQDWFEEIKTWRESLAKYQPDWEEILAATTEVKKTVEKPVNKSTAISVDDEKNSDDTNKEKAPKRKPIVFDLEVNDKDIEVNPIDIVKAKPIPAKPKLDKFEDHQDDDDLIILDETEEEAEGGTQIKSSIFNRLGGKIGDVVVPSLAEGDLRGNLSLNKKQAFPDIMARRNRFKNDAVDTDASTRRKPARGRSRSRSRKRRVSSSSSSYSSSSRSSSESYRRRRRRRSSSHRRRRSRSHSRRSHSRNRDSHRRGRSYSPRRASGPLAPGPVRPPLQYPAPPGAPMATTSWVPNTLWSVPPPPIVPRPPYPPQQHPTIAPAAVYQPPAMQQPRMALPLPKPTTLVVHNPPTQSQPDHWPSTSMQQLPGPAYSTQPVAVPAKGLDFQAMLHMNPGEEMLRYVQSKSYDYARELDTKHPDFRRIIGRIVDNKMLPVDGQKVLPCGPFNKNDSCPYAGLGNICHPGPVGISIHACSLCYFCLGGLFNFHRQTACPLLSTFTS